MEHLELLCRAPIVGYVPDKAAHGWRDCALLPVGLKSCGALEADPEAVQASSGKEQSSPMLLPSLCSGKGVSGGRSFPDKVSFSESLSWATLAKAQNQKFGGKVRWLESSNGLFVWPDTCLRQTSALRDATAVSLKFPETYLQANALSALFRFPLIEGKAQFLSLKWLLF